ncbi:MAG: polysaccharide biosynthesis protein [Thalassovita sp.]
MLSVTGHAYEKSVRSLYRYLLKAPREHKALLLQVVELLAVTFACAGTALILHRLIPETVPTWALLLSWLSAAGLSGVLTMSLGLNHTRLMAYRGAELLQSSLVAVSTSVMTLALPLGVGHPLPAEFALVFGVLYLTSAVTARIVLREFVIRVYEKGQNRQRVLIYGAGQTGQQLVDALRTDNTLLPVCFVDDNPTLQSRSLRGLPVFAPERIADLVESKEIDRVLMAMPSASRPVQARVEEKLRRLGCAVQRVPSFSEFVLGNHAAPLRHVTLPQLMNRKMLENELPEVRNAYQGKRVLVTGAGGSIGSEICRQMLTCKPKVLVLLDHSELALFQIERELSELPFDVTIVPVLGSICEGDLIRDVLDRYRVDTILHAAAYKHVPMVECNLVEGLRNNVLGTKILADAAMQAGVKQFTLISSDKAVRPTSVMGSSKRLAEMVIQDMANRSTSTKFGMVRFGNVLGSSGSVVPLFREQIAQGGPVTVTHPDVSRFFMTISEAVRLVLLAGTFDGHGGVLVLKMGKPILIRDVARQMIEGAGMTVKDSQNPNGDIEITFTGLRPGEKLQEELLLRQDMITTPHEKIMRSPERGLSELEMASALRDLRNAIQTRNSDAALAVLDRWIEGRGMIGPHQAVPAE